MQRTQIYLTELEQEGVQRLAQARGSTVSAVIREALDQYLQASADAAWSDRRLAAFGLWSAIPAAEPETVRGEERFGDWHADR